MCNEAPNTSGFHGVQGIVKMLGARRTGTTKRAEALLNTEGRYQLQTASAHAKQACQCNLFSSVEGIDPCSTLQNVGARPEMLTE
jgi:hypothetical protein